MMIKGREISWVETSYIEEDICGKSLLNPMLFWQEIPDNLGREISSYKQGEYVQYFILFATLMFCFFSSSGAKARPMSVDNFTVDSFRS